MWHERTLGTYISYNKTNNRFVSRIIKGKGKRKEVKHMIFNVKTHKLSLFRVKKNLKLNIYREKTQTNLM